MLWCLIVYIGFVGFGYCDLFAMICYGCYDCFAGVGLYVAWWWFGGDLCLDG